MGKRNEPGEVGVGELLLAVLPPLVPVVVRRVRVRGPGALIFPADFDIFFKNRRTHTVRLKLAAQISRRGARRNRPRTLRT